MCGWCVERERSIQVETRTHRIQNILHFRNYNIFSSSASHSPAAELSSTFCNSMYSRETNERIFSNFLRFPLSLPATFYLEGKFKRKILFFLPSTFCFRFYFLDECSTIRGYGQPFIFHIAYKWMGSNSPAPIRTKPFRYKICYSRIRKTSTLRLTFVCKMFVRNGDPFLPAAAAVLLFIISYRRFSLFISISSCCVCVIFVLEKD